MQYKIDTQYSNDLKNFTYVSNASQWRKFSNFLDSLLKIAIKSDNKTDIFDLNINWVFKCESFQKYSKSLRNMKSYKIDTQYSNDLENFSKFYCTIWKLDFLDIWESLFIYVNGPIELKTFSLRFSRQQPHVLCSGAFERLHTTFASIFIAQLRRE